MPLQRKFLLYAIVAASAAVPAIAQTPASVGAATGTTEMASVPDFTGTWQHPVFPWFEPPASGPGPITNLSRWPQQRPAGAAGSAGLPPSKTGISDYDQLVG